MSKIGSAVLEELESKDLTMEELIEKGLGNEDN
mgnify:CR=1 FL=1